MDEVEKSRPLVFNGSTGEACFLSESQIYAEHMGSFEHNGQSYPRLQFWQIDDAYFENPEVINTFVRLPMEWRIRPSQKSERHFGGQQTEFFR